MGTMILNRQSPTKGFDLLDAIKATGVNTFDTVAVYGTESECTLGTGLCHLVRTANQQERDFYAIVGAKSGQEMQENIAALDLQISSADCFWLNLEIDTRASSSKSI
jgi:aryl-alcohol dehydrogenase-like predicted oxidoreductase